MFPLPMLAMIVVAQQIVDQSSFISHCRKSICHKVPGGNDAANKKQKTKKSVQDDIIMLKNLFDQP